MNRRHALGRAVMLAVLLVAGLGSVLGSAASSAESLASPPAGQVSDEPAGPDASPARLELAAVPAWSQIESVAAIDLRIEPATPGLELVATLHQQVRSRTAFTQTLEGRVPPDLGEVVLPLDDLGAEAGTPGTHRLTLDLGTTPPPIPEPVPTTPPPTDDPSPDEPPAEEPPPALPRIPVGEPGVYPLELRLQVAGTSTNADSLLTYLVVLDEDNPPVRLSVAWVWPIGLDLPWLPDGSVARTLAPAVEPGGRLASFSDALAAAPLVPVTLAPDPATFDAWSALVAAPPDATAAGSDPAAPDTTDPTSPSAVAAQRLDAMRAALAGDTHQVLSPPYHRVDLPTLSAAGLDDEIAQQLIRGAEVLRESLEVRPDTRTHLASSLDDQALGLLRDFGVDQLVTSPDVLTPVAQRLTPARPFEIRSRGRTFRTAIADAELAALLDPAWPQSESSDPLSEASVAQRFLAALTLISLEAPGEARGVAVVPPTRWTPGPDILLRILNGLVEHPSLNAVTVDGLFDAVESVPGAEGERELDLPVFENRTLRELAITPASVRSTRARMESLERMMPGGEGATVEIDRLLLLAESTPAQQAGTSPSAGDFLRAADDRIAEILGAIRLPGEQTVTLTARRGAVPVTFVNETGAPVRIRVHLVSDKLLFPSGAVHDIELPPRSTTARFTVEARSTGTFPMTVEVSSPDGVLPLGTFRLNIRSTAVSGVALALTVGAGLFLVGWWGNYLRKARRSSDDEDALDHSMAPEIP